jgi:hypothetical protein
VNSTVANAPVEVGEQISYSKGAHNNQGFGSTGDFVFAYRVREIFYKKGVLKTREYNKGAVLGDEMVPVSKEDSELVYVIEEAEIDDDDVEVEGEVFPFGEEDGEDCVLVV